MKPVAVVFDLYGTLVDYASLASRFAGNVAAPDAFVAAWRTKQLTYAMAATLMDRYRDFDELTGRAYAYAAAVHDAPRDAAAIADAIAAWSSLPAFDDVAPTLEALAASDISAAVLSNGTPTAIAATLDGAGLRDRFARTLSVDAVRAFKPDRRVYALATAAFDCSPERIVFVSSNGWDAMGAAEFGFRVVWCNRGKLPAETMGVPPAATIETLADLITRLE